MLRKFLRSKIHRATVTQTDPDYVGSITIDAKLLAAAGMAPNEAVLVADIDTGVRFETYIFEGAAGSGIIGINGAAAKLCNLGDKVIIMSFGYLTDAPEIDHHASVIVVDEANAITDHLDYPSVLSGAVHTSG